MIGSVERCCSRCCGSVFFCDLCISSLLCLYVLFFFFFCFVFFQAEDGIRDLVRSRGLGDVYKRQVLIFVAGTWYLLATLITGKKLFMENWARAALFVEMVVSLSLIHI